MTSNFDCLLQKLQANKEKLYQNKEELAKIVNSLDIHIEPEAASLNISQHIS